MVWHRGMLPSQSSNVTNVAQGYVSLSSVQSTNFKNWLEKSRYPYTLVEIRFVGFTLMFSTTSKTHRSDISSSRNRKKTPKNNLRQSVWSTNFKNWLKKSHNPDTLVEIGFVEFPLTFTKIPKTCRSDICSSIYCGKTPKTNLRQSVQSTNFEI